MRAICGAAMKVTAMMMLATEGPNLAMMMIYRTITGNDRMMSAIRISSVSTQPR